MKFMTTVTSGAFELSEAPEAQESPKSQR